MAYDFARRTEIARAKGFPSARAYRLATPAEREQASRDLAARDPNYRAAPVVAAQNQKVAATGSHIMPHGTGEVLVSNKLDKIAAVEKSVLAKGRTKWTVDHMILKFQDAAGNTRTARTHKRRGQSIKSFRRGMIAAGGLEQYAKDILDAMYDGVVAVLDIQMSLSK